jgi:hypothetical protein
MVLMIMLPRSRCANRSIELFSFVLWMLSLLIGSGCKQEQLDQIVKQVQEQTIDQLPPPMKVVSTGAFKLQVDKPIESNKANVRLIVIGDGRPNVLQIRSYQDIAADEFPSILAQANTTATDVSLLVGKTLDATVYISASKFEPIWSCLDQSTAKLTINSFQENVLQGELRCDKLISSQDIASPLSGTWEAILQSQSVSTAQRTSLRDQLVTK